MSLIAPPPVVDPVRRDIDDAVIEQAKRRARRRRWRNSILVATAVVTAAALAAWNPPPPLQDPPPAGDGGAAAGSAGGAGRDPSNPSVLRVGFVGLPPEGAAPSSPPTGNLIRAVLTDQVRLWLYEDGRLISYRNNGPEAAANALFSGFLEQHLTPEGVRLLQSEPGCLPRPYGRCNRLTRPETWLPASAWADQQYRAYVPSEFRVCYGGWVMPDGMPPAQWDGFLSGPPVDLQPAPAQLVRAALPPAASALLSPVTTPDSAAGSSESDCAVVSTKGARTIDHSFQAAGFQQPEDTEPHMLRYAFNLPPDAGQSAWIQASVVFQPVLPHGSASCTSCG